ncbi:MULTISPECIES: hypothetical protein [Chryseobacterium]|uniref:hypothetical protein n=1 Tax=Chryseobacterium TaxID=59732 RepID=UPI0013DDD68D|nr:MULTISPECIES: hypothetical protein [Chryseobacterium]UCA58282.1 hypothetical protein KB553_14645 [Chryseobacterium rhizoplanae]
MKHLKKLTQKSLKNINGGAQECPPVYDSCEAWCRWTPWQKSHCILGELCMPCDDN